EATVVGTTPSDSVRRGSPRTATTAGPPTRPAHLGRPAPPDLPICRSADLPGRTHMSTADVARAAAGPETIFTYGAPTVKFGPGASDEIGFDLAQYGVRRALVITDAGVAATGAPQRVAERMAEFGIEARVFSGVHVEPTDQSLREAAEQA